MTETKAPSYDEMTQNLRAPKGWLTTFLNSLVPGEPKETPYVTPSTAAMAKAAAARLGFRVAVTSRGGEVWVARVIEPSKVPFEPSMSYHVSPVSEQPTPITRARSSKKVVETEAEQAEQEETKEPLGFSKPSMPQPFDA